MRTGVGAFSRWRITVAIACFAVSAILAFIVAWRSSGGFCDLHVYRAGGQYLLDGRPLSQVSYAGYLPFTYPPAAALAFTMLAVLPWPVAAALTTAASEAGLAAALYLALRLRPVPGWLSRAAAARIALAAAAAAIWLEPVRTTLSYGQVNVLLVLLILWDLSRPDGARLKGAAIGLAAGLKLTPAIFILYLLATRRYRAAAIASATLTGTIAAGYVVVPASSAWYWGGTFLDPAHVGGVSLTMNQSLSGLIDRAAGTARPGWPAVAAVALAGLAGLALAARAGRAGDDATGFSLCAIAGLLACPISWTHHWVIAVPALLLAVAKTWHNGVPTRPAGLATAGTIGWSRLAGLAALAGVAIVGWTRLVRRVSAPAGPLHLSPLHMVTGDAYVLIGLAVLVVVSASYRPAGPHPPGRARTPEPSATVRAARVHSALVVGSLLRCIRSGWSCIRDATRRRRSKRYWPGRRATVPGSWVSAMRSRG